MFKIASDIFIRAFLLFLSRFLKIFCWVPLPRRTREKTSGTQGIHFPDSGLYLLNGLIFILIYFEWRDTKNQQ